MAVVDPGAVTAEQQLSADRRARLREHLARADFDAVLLTTPESIFYATGYRSVAAGLFANYPMAVLISGDRLIMVAGAAETAPLMADGFPADDVVPFGRFYFAGTGPATDVSDRHPDFVAALAAALSVVRWGRLGVESSNLGPAGQAVVDEYTATNTDASGWATGVRSVKLPGEQSLLRRAAELAEAGIEAALAILKPGVTEHELATAVATTMAAGGGLPRFVVVASGERSPLADAFPTGRACRVGDLVRFDIGCQYEGYWSDIARTAVVGEPTDLQYRRYQALLDGLWAEFEAARPGVSASTVFEAALRTVESNGLAPYRRHHVGHAIGLSIYEQPIIGSGRTELLEPGMVFCLETPYYELGWGGMMVEDTGVVTEKGFDLFTSIDRSLRVAPA